MRSLFVLFTICAFCGDSIPFKQSEEYELKLEFKFKPRPIDSGTIKFPTGYEKTPQSAGPLPYLYLHLVVVRQLEDEVKIKVVTNDDKVMYSRKVEMGKKVSLDLGFTDDLKDHVTPFEYTYLFLNDEKEVKRRIVVRFESDGTYLVNEERRGKI